MKNFNNYLFEMEEIQNNNLEIQNEMTGQEILTLIMTGTSFGAGVVGFLTYVIKDIIKNKKIKNIGEIRETIKKLKKENPTEFQKIKTEIEKIIKNTDSREIKEQKLKELSEIKKQKIEEFLKK
jgi:glutamate synthase domain-containing protein 3